MLIIAVVLTVSCGAAERIVGTWKNQNTVLGVVVETTYVFNEDGTGSIGALLDIPINMTYVVEKDVLTITYNTLGVETIIEYTVAFSGETLTLTNDSETITLKKAE